MSLDIKIYYDELNYNKLKMAELKKKTICLCMIVKNESKILKRAFDSVIDYIDYWVICDTGSTDGTQELITEYFKEKKIAGDLHQHEWKNFGLNRSLAVSACKNKADYILLFDADYILNVIDPNFKQNLNVDSYLVKEDGNLDYRRTLLISGSLDWKYVGVTHEYINCTNPNYALSTTKMDGFTIIHKCDGGHRPDKFTNDIKMLLQGLIDEPTNGRYMFYLANSYHDVGDYENAIKYYEQRVSHGGWHEETYISLYKIGKCNINLKKDFVTIYKSLMKAYKFRPSRLEALYHLIMYCRNNDLHDIGYYIGINGVNKEYPSDILFIEKDIHEYKLKDEVAICAYWANEHASAIKLNQEMLDDSRVPECRKAGIKSNMQYSLDKLKN